MGVIEVPVSEYNANPIAGYNSLQSYGEFGIQLISDTSQHVLGVFSSYPQSLRGVRIAETLANAITGENNIYGYAFIAKPIDGTTFHRYRRDNRTGGDGNQSRIYSLYHYNYNGDTYSFYIANTGSGMQSVNYANIIATGIYDVTPLSSFSEVISELDLRPDGYSYPITYRLTNCTAPDAPSEASVGSTVTVPFVFPDGYGIANNENVYVTNNGVIVPSTYSDGVLTFEMPNPD